MCDIPINVMVRYPKSLWSPIVNSPVRNKGATLLHVLILMSVLSSILIADTAFRAQKAGVLALDYTVAQTDMLLNEAYSYFQENNRWPDCANWLPQIRNGWGVNVYCEYANSSVVGLSPNLNNAREFLIRQYLPTDLGGVFQGRYLDADVGSPISNMGYIYPAGFRAYTVRTNRAGGANQTIDVGLLESTGPALIDKLQCQAGENRHVFSALNGIASALNSPESILTIRAYLSCFLERELVPRRWTRFGYQINIIDNPSDAVVESGYDMYRQRYGATIPAGSGIDNVYFDGGDIGITGSNLSGSWGCYVPYISSYDRSNSTGGNSNARYDTPGYPITTLVFQYCAPSTP